MLFKYLPNGLALCRCLHKSRVKKHQTETQFFPIILLRRNKLKFISANTRGKCIISRTQSVHFRSAVRSDEALFRFFPPHHSSDQRRGRELSAFERLRRRGKPLFGPDRPVEPRRTGQGGAERVQGGEGRVVGGGCVPAGRWPGGESDARYRFLFCFLRFF